MQQDPYGQQPPQYPPQQRPPQPYPQPQYPAQPQQPFPPGRQPSARTYKTAARRQKSTAIHGILTIVTVGLWSPVWIMACAENARIRRAQAEVARYQASQPRYR